jgi:hypothetical protein
VMCQVIAKANVTATDGTLTCLGTEWQLNQIKPSTNYNFTFVANWRSEFGSSSNLTAMFVPETPTTSINIITKATARRAR